MHVRFAMGAVAAALVLVAAQAADARTSEHGVPEADRATVAEAQRTVALYERTDPSMARLLERADGYAVFPAVVKGAVGVGAAHGDGILFERGKPIGKTSLTQVTVGAQLGGQEYSEVIVFQTSPALTDFSAGRLNFAAQMSAVALKAGASADAKFTNGVAVFTATKGGLMFEASVGGQKFSYEPFPITKK